MDQEKLLIKQISDGNTHAFRLLIKQYEKLVVHIAGRMIHNKEDLEKAEFYLTKRLERENEIKEVK